MKNRIAVAALLLGLTFAPGCALTNQVGKILVGTPSPIQITQVAADGIDAANKLGEIVLQLQVKSHTLKLNGILPREGDDSVQLAAIAFANAKDKAVADINKAQTSLQVAAAIAPLLGSMTTIGSTLKGVSGIKTLTGVAGIVSNQLPDLLAQASAIMNKYTGGK